MNGNRTSDALHSKCQRLFPPKKTVAYVNLLERSRAFEVNGREGGLSSNSNMPSDSHHRGGNPCFKFDIGSDRDTDQAPR